LGGECMSSLRIREDVAEKPLVESVGGRCAQLGVRVECAGRDVLLHSGHCIFDASSGWVA
jgi:hypothetical protein